MLPAAITVSPETARRFHRRAVGLDAPATGIAGVLAHLGYVQIDPINVCGRMQDHILRNRLPSYREGDLTWYLHGAAGTPKPAAERLSFEHHLPDSNVLVAFPLDAWPHLLAAMHRRGRHPGAWAGKLTPTERQLAERIVGEMAERGPLSSEDIDDDRRPRRPVWGAFSLAKTTLQKLFFHGRVLIAARQNNRRLYDLPERVLPASVLALSEPPPDDTARWLVQLKLRQRRLVTLRRDEIPLVEDVVQPVSVDGCPTLYCLRGDIPLFDEAGAVAPRRGRAASDGPPLLIAPLDPLIYDRRLTERLWSFDYTWEVYTPPARRKRGYYALPVLVGTELVGHVDVKADRKAGCLTVVSHTVNGRQAIDGALRGLATFLGVTPGQASRGTEDVPGK